MFTLDTYVLVKCTHFIVWISDGHRGYSLRPIWLCFALWGAKHDDMTHVSIRTLRSSDAPVLAVPRTRTELARRAFSVSLSVWNSLPADIRLCESVSLFKRHLKTHLFRLA